MDPSGGGSEFGAGWDAWFYFRCALLRIKQPALEPSACRKVEVPAWNESCGLLRIAEWVPVYCYRMRVARHGPQGRFARDIVLDMGANSSPERQLYLAWHAWHG